MAAKPTIITCPNCATKNRVRPHADGIPRCSVCHTTLPWIVETDAGGFDEEITASVPVLVDFWAPPAQLRAVLERHVAAARPPGVSAGGD